MGASNEIIRQLGKNISGYSLEVTKAAIQQGIFTDAQVIQILRAKELSLEEAKQTATTLSLSAAEKEATGNTLAFGTATKGLWATMKAHPIMTVTAAIGLAYGAYSKWKQIQEENRQIAEDVANTYADTSKSIDEYAKKYEELHTALLEAKGNEEDIYNVKKQLLELQTELNEKFGDEYGKLNLVTDAYKDQTDAIKSYNKEAAKALLNDISRSEQNKAIDEMSNQKHYNLNVGGTAATTGEGKALQRLIKQYENQGVSSQTNDGMLFIHLNADPTSAEQTINDFMTDVSELAKELGDEHIFDEVLDISKSSKDEAKKTISNWGDIYEKTLMGQIALDDDLSSGMEKATQAVKDYNDAILKSEDPYNDENVLKAYEDLQKIKESIQDDGAWDKYSSVIDNVFAQADTKLVDFAKKIKDNEWNIGSLVDDIEKLNLNDIDLKADADAGSAGVVFDSLALKANRYGITIEELISLLTRLGIVSGNTADAATELPKAFSKSEMITAINATTDGFESLDKIMSSMKDKNPFNYALLDDKNFKDTFGGLEESYENFVEKISNSPKDVKGCQSAFDDLLTTWLNSTDIISGLSDETAQLTIDMLTNRGVANAQEVVVAALAQKHAEAAWSSRDLTNATAEEITALANESEATDDARTSFETYIVQKMLAEAAIDTTGDISALANVVNALGLATGAWQKYYAAKSRMAEIAADPNYVGREENGDIVSKETVLSQYAALAGTYQKEYAEDLEKMAKEKASYGGGVKTGKSGSGGGSKGSKSKEATEFDTAAESIKNLRAQLDSLNTILENTDPYSQKLDTLNLIIAKQKEYNDALKSQADVYQAEYQKALSALPQQWQDNITGDKNFSIDEVPASLKDAVNRAQDFKDKWTSVNQSILQANRELEDTKQKVYDLAQTKLDNKIGLIENKISDVQNKMDEADAMGLQATKKQYKNMLSLSKQEASIYQDKLQGLMAVMAAMEAAGATDTDNYYKTAEAIQSCEDAISKCAQSQAKWNKAMLELPIQYLERANDELNDQLDGLKEEQNRLDGAINGVTAHLQNQIDIQQKLRDEAEKAADEKIDAINKEKDALQEVNEKRKQQLDLEQKQYDLERAKNQKTTKVFKEESGDFVYEADQNAIRDAQDSYDEVLFNKQISDLDDKIKDIEDARDELLNSYDEEIDRLQKIMDSWNDITDAIQRAKDMAMANSILGSGWEDRVTSGDTSDIGSITGKYEQNDKQQSWVEEQIEANERLIREVERYVEAWQMGEMSIREARESINDIVGDIAPEIEANDERVNSLSSYQAQWSNANQTVNSDIAAINAATTNNVEELTATEQRRAAAQLYADQWATNVLTVGDSLNSITTANSDATLAEGQFLDTRITKLTSFQSSYAAMAANIAARCREIVQACREAERAMDRLEKKESKGGYAKGTENAKPGFHEVAEGNKPEIIVKNDGSALLAKRETLYPFEGGETVLNAGDTKDILSRENFKPLSMSQLMAFTNSDDSAMMKSAIPDNVIRKNEIISVSRTEKQENVEIKINNLNLPRVKDPDSFAKGMYDGSFRSAVQQKKYSRK